MKNVLNFSFGSGRAFKDFIKITHETVFDNKNGYGWIYGSKLYSRERAIQSRLKKSFVLGLSDAVFRCIAPPGIYRVRMVFGDSLYSDHHPSVSVSTKSDVKKFTSKLKLNEYITYTFSITNQDSFIDFTFSSPVNNWIINSILIIEDSKTKADSVKRVMLPESKWQQFDASLNPSLKTFTRLLESKKVGIPAVSSGLGRNDYLASINGIVEYFIPYQRDDGAIIDPILGSEFQYSTPMFSYASALLVREQQRMDLLDNSIKAFELSLLQLGRRQAPNAHEDFYSMPLAHAYKILRNYVDKKTQDKWVDGFHLIEPYETYRTPAGGADGPGSNWNCKALSGEFFLYKFGLRKSRNFFESSLKLQARFFNNEFGLYVEGPMVYDIFPRAWLSLMTYWGYGGDSSQQLKDALERGLLTSLLIQSPTGEIPCGGRSSHHQWPDAMQCIIFEIASKISKANENSIVAGIYKRAAMLALKQIKIWEKPSGDYSVVKNFSHIAYRHGYESYSSHSQYNLLLAAALGFAYEVSDGNDESDERITPAESGSHHVLLPPPFNKLIANKDGTYVVICLTREDRQTPAGLVRVHFSGYPGVIGVSDGLLKEVDYRLPTGGRISLSVGIYWLDGMEKKSIAGLKSEEFGSEISHFVDKKQEYSFDVTYKVTSEFQFSEFYKLRKGLLEISYDLSDVGHECGIRFPVLVSDGENLSTLNIDTDCVTVNYKGSQVKYLLSGCSELRLTDELYPHRNGFIKVIEAVAKKPAIKLTIQAI